MAAPDHAVPTDTRGNALRFRVAGSRLTVSAAFDGDNVLRRDEGLHPANPDDCRAASPGETGPITLPCAEIPPHPWPGTTEPSRPFPEVAGSYNPRCAAMVQCYVVSLYVIPRCVFSLIQCGRRHANAGGLHTKRIPPRVQYCQNLLTMTAENDYYQGVEPHLVALLGKR